MRVILALCLLLLACTDNRPKPPDGGGDTTPVDTTQPPDTLSVDADDTIDTDLYHVDADDTLLKAIIPSAESVAPAPTRRTANLRVASVKGRPLGPTLYLPDDWCDGFVTGTIVSGQPDRIPATLKKARVCNMRISLTIPRTYMTANGQPTGDFSPSRAKSAVDQIAAALNKVPTTDRDFLIYFSVLDDMACTQCWGGHEVTKEETRAHSRYARSKFPSWVAVGLRATPSWMVGWTDWGVDVAAIQWHKRKGPKNLDGVPKLKAYIQAESLAATRVGLRRLMYSVNVHDCGGPSTPPCTPDELREFGKVLIDADLDRNCAFLGWRYDGVYFQRPEYQSAWKYLVGLAAAKPRMACKT